MATVFCYKCSDIPVCTQVKELVWKIFATPAVPASKSPTAHHSKLPVNNSVKQQLRPPATLTNIWFTMAAGSMDAGVREDRQYGGRITAVVVLSCATATMAGAIFGYDLGASGGVSSMEPFLREFLFFPDVYLRMKSGDGRAVSNYCKFDSQLLTLFTSSLYIYGLLTVMLLASWVTARNGLRPSMIIGAAACLAGAAVSSGAVNVYMTILGRALLGVGLGFANQAVLLYLSEMPPARYRGAFSNGFQFSLCLGSLAATVVNYGSEKITGGWGWRVSLALAGVPAVLLAVGAIFLPETPNSLVHRGKDLGEVKALLQKIRGIDAVDEELDIVAAAAESSARGGNGMRLILTKRRYRPQLVMAILIPAFTQLTGINAVGFYAPELLRTIGLGESGVPPAHRRHGSRGVLRVIKGGDGVS